MLNNLLTSTRKISQITFSLTTTGCGLGSGPSLTNRRGNEGERAHQSQNEAEGTREGEGQRARSGKKSILGAEFESSPYS